jgi:hypothetical protein
MPQAVEGDQRRVDLDSEAVDHLARDRLEGEAGNHSDILVAA